VLPRGGEDETGYLNDVASGDGQPRVLGSLRHAVGAVGGWGSYQDVRTPVSRTEAAALLHSGASAMPMHDIVTARGGRRQCLTMQRRRCRDV
jgi:hypothetical protein